MTTTATLETPTVSLDPGGVGAVPLVIRNNGDIVEGYRLEVVGPARSWASVEPEEISLYPGASTTATVMFFPPRSASIPAGELRYGVRVVPTEHPDDTVVPEGAIDVLPFADTTAELVPRTSQGRRGALVRIAVDNRGNTPVTVGLRAWDQAEQIAFGIKPSVLTVPAGQAAFVDAKLRAARTIWRGQPRTLPFTVAVESHDATAVTLDGTFVQQTMFPTWLFKALMVALALLAALIALWFLVLKGAVKSAAKEAAQGQVAAASRAADAAVAAADKAGTAAGSAAGAATDAGTSANQARTLVGAPALPTVDTPLSERLDVKSSPGPAGKSDAYVVPDGATLKLTDLVMSNPQGDFGRVLIEVADRVLFDSALENFRDLDYHFVTPILGHSGEQVKMTVRCNAVGVPPDVTPAPTQCDTAVFFGGVLSSPATP